MTNVDYRVIASAYVHPLRIAIVEFMAATPDTEWSPVELAELLEQSLGVVSYHVKALADAELLAKTRTRPRRGAVQTFYKLTAKAIARPGGPPPDSFLRCTVCGRESTTDFASSLRQGWEKCCGYTMRLVRTDADVAAATVAAVDAQLPPLRGLLDRVDS